MRAAQWSSVLFLISVGFLLVLRFLTAGPGGAEDPSHPDQGTLAPLLDPLPRRVEIARAPPELGRVVDLAVDGDAVAVLSEGGWLLQGESSRVTWTGDPTPGSPNWLSRPVSIALAPGAVYVLDEKRSLVTVWDTAGRRVRELPLLFGSSYAQRPTQLLLGPGGRPLVTMQRVDAGGPAFWDIIGYDEAGPPTPLLSIPSESRSMVFSEPLLAMAGSTLLSMGPLSHEVARVDLAGGGVTRLSQRPDPPRWYVSKRHRRDYARMLQGLGGAAAELAELPEFWPSVRGFSVRSDGSFLVAVTAGEDRQHIELLTDGAIPMGRFNADGFVEPVFLSQGRVFLVEEGTEETVIYELIPGET